MKLLDELLPAPQRQKTYRLSGKRYIEYSLGRLLLVNALAKSGHRDPRIIEQGQGAPLIELQTCADSSNVILKNPTFSISHSKGWIGVAYCESDKNTTLGLDIEKLKLDFNDKQAAYFCNQHQMQTAQSLSGIKKASYLTRLWTQKEAFCKSLGVSVLSKQAKEADFEQNTGMHSSCLADEYFVSIYSNQNITIDSYLLRLDADGKLLEEKSSILNWGGV